MSELKPKSFRIDEETAEKFKEISTSLGGNQQETLSKLIESYEFQAGKAVLTEKKADIEQFERYATILTRMFMASLEDNQNITSTVRTEFEGQLQSKDQIIQDLQKQIKDNTTHVEECDRIKNTAIKEKEDLQEKLDRAEKEYRKKIDDLRLTFSEKQTANDILTDSLNTFKKKCQSLEQQLENSQKLVEEVESLRNEITTLKKQHLEEVDRYQQKYKELLEKLEKKVEQPAKKTTTPAKKKNTKKTGTVEMAEGEGKKE